MRPRRDSPRDPVRATFGTTCGVSPSEERMRLAVPVCLICCLCGAPLAHAALVPSATGSRQHVTSNQPLGSSLQPISFPQTDLNTTGGTPAVATRAGLYQI